MAILGGMRIDRDGRRFMKLYPQVFFACHTRHARDPKTWQKVTSRQLRILDHLDDGDGLPLGDLAAHLDVTPSTLSLTIDRLEAKGYVVRRRGTVDRRQVMVRLTPAGIRLRDAQTVLDPLRVQRLLERLSITDRKRVLAALQKLAVASCEMAGATRSETGFLPRKQRAQP